MFAPIGSVYVNPANVKQVKTCPDRGVVIEYVDGSHEPVFDQSAAEVAEALNLAIEESAAAVAAQVAGTSPAAAIITTKKRAAAKAKK